MTTGSASDDIVGRYSRLARAAMAGDTITDCDGDAFDDGCFGAAAYADDPRRTRRCSAREPGLRQPGRGSRHQAGRNRAGPRLRRRPGRPALRPQNRPGRHRLRPGRQRRHAHPGPRQRRTGRSAQRPVPARPHRRHPAARRPRRRRHLQLRHQPVRRQAPGARRGIPGPQARRQARRQRRHRRRHDPAAAARRGRTAGRLPSRDPYPPRVPRPADVVRLQPHSHHHHPASRRRAALGDHPSGQTCHARRHGSQCDANRTDDRQPRRRRAGHLPSRH